MATYRTVYLSFWTDSKVEDEFTPEDKYFYLYLLTNPHTNLCGCYEISMSSMVRDTGYNEDAVKRLITRMEKVHHVIRYNAPTKEILVLKWHKYNWSKSRDVLNGAEKVAGDIKCDVFRDYVYDILEQVYAHPVQRVYTPSIDPLGISVTVSVTDTVTDTDTDTVINNTVNKSKRSNNRPTLEEVQDYCNERGNIIDAQEFVDYYASQNWKKANGQPLVDWKAGVRYWESKKKNDSATKLPRKEQERANALSDLERRYREALAREEQENEKN